MAILGLGAIGGFLASIFWKQGVLVTCIGKPEQVRVINEHGIRLESARFGEVLAYPQAVHQLNYEPDLLFIAVKAPFLNDALGLVSRALVSNSVVIPLLNGFEHVSAIRERVGNRVAVGMIGAIEAVKVGWNHIIHSSRHAPHIELASNHDIPKKDLCRIGEFLSRMGVETLVCNREAEVIWRKLARLNAIASTTAASQETIGFIRQDPVWRRKLEGCVGEGVAVARKEGVKIDPEAVMHQIDALPPTLTTSLQRDIGKRIPSEVDAIPGAILRLAKLHHVPCPAIQEVYTMIMERIR
ncbi:MAG: 2-dehydropantoate 2-reductase [bacterium]|uniref:2-dehydropantoate 2-reductase n=1 Tax=Candidatus Methylomirabilis tolerans TaxID=3123416 RepID=A0AAJ1AJ79_9BACT|nr:2-dehydropantoate 2-reductase [Candidatus Methylomirabilis sp.]